MPSPKGCSRALIPVELTRAGVLQRAVVARTTVRRVSLRLLPFLFVLYICNFLDRTNVGIEALLSARPALSFSPRAPDPS